MTEKKSNKVLRFIQLLPNTPPTIVFSDKDLPGSGKRIDILCRVLAACFDWGPSKLQNTALEVMAIFANKTTLTILHPNDIAPQGEVAWGKLIRDALQGNPPDFIKIADQGVNMVLNRLLHEKSSRVFVLDEHGDPISDSILKNAGAQNSFMLGDHRGFDSESLRIIRDREIKKISLGEKSYLSSHCVAAMISKFERFSN